MRGRADSKDLKASSPRAPSAAARRCRRLTALGPLLAAAAVLGVQASACAAGAPRWVVSAACAPVAWAVTVGGLALATVVCVPATATVGTSPAPTLDAIRDDAGAVRAFHWATRALTFALSAGVAYILAAHVRDIAAFHVVIQLGVVHSIVSAAARGHRLVRTHVFIPLAPRCARFAGLPARHPPLHPASGVEMVEWHSMARLTAAAAASTAEHGSARAPSDTPPRKSAATPPSARDFPL